MNRSLIIINILESEFTGYLAIEVSFFEEVFFLPLSASLRECYAHLEEIALGIDLDWYYRGSHLFGFLCEAHDLLVRDEEESLSFGLILGTCIGLVLGYMTSDEDRATRVDRDV